jgi:putative ABC transport system permease protein
MNLGIAIRPVRHRPGFALTAALTLALGIGLSTAVFTVAEALLLRDLPVWRQERLVVLWSEAIDGSFAHWPLELDAARQFARETRLLDGVAFAAYEGAWPQPVRDEGGLSRLRQAHVSGEFFSVLRAEPLLGRALRPDDDVVGAAPVVVLSHGAWKRHYGGDTAVVGRRFVLHGNAVSYEIVGVMPPGLDYPRGTDFWAPLVPGKARRGTNTIFAHVDLVGRLGPAVSAVNAKDDLSAFLRRSPQPQLRKTRAVVTSLPALILGDTRPAVLAFAAAAALLLVITCINVVNLLLVRGLARTREMAVRTALGAGRGQIVRQLMTENAMLAVAGGALGVIVAMGAVQGFVAFAPTTLPRIDEIHLNTAALSAAVLITAFATLLFGVGPAIMGARVEPQGALRSGNRQSVSRRARFATEALVTGQVALAVLVLSAAGLIGRSLVKLERADLAFEPSHLLIGELAFRFDRVDTRAKQLALLDRLIPAVRSIPGVRAVSPIVAVPFSGSGGWDGNLTAEGQPADAVNPILNMEVVVPEYFRTFGMPILRGRGFSDDDREGAHAVVISESAARHYWPSAEPVGQHLLMGSSRFTVIGVVPDTRYRELKNARPSIYFALRQSIFPFAPLSLAVRTAGPPADVVPALRRAIATVDPGIDLASAAPFDSYLDKPLAQPRLNAFLLVIFAAAAVALAAIGLFGVMATMVRQRTWELGLRMALGATGGDVMRLVLGRGLAIAAGGIALGLVAAAGANRLLTALLYGVTPTDGVTIGSVTALLIGVAVIAAGIPARSGTRIDPAIALRAEG